MHTKRSCLIGASILFAAFVVCWASVIFVAGDVSYPPGPNPWYCYPSFLFTVALLVPVAALAGRWWYWFPAYFSFGTFLVAPIGMFVADTSVYPRFFSTACVLEVSLPAIAGCYAAGVLAAWVGLRSHRHAVAGAAMPNHARDRVKTSAVLLP